MRNLFLLFVAVCLAFQSQAQSFLKLTDTLYFVNATPTDTSSILDSIYNTSATPFTGLVKFQAKATVGGLDSSLGQIDSVSFAADTLNALGTPATAKALHIHIPYSNPVFIGGPTGVVIWPVYIGGAAGPYDSIKVVVTMPTVGLEEAPLAKMYLLQFAGSLSIRFGDYENLIKQVSLYDVTGRMVFSGTSQNSKNIPTSGWTTGIYFCELTTYHGERRTIKFVLQ